VTSVQLRLGRIAKCPMLSAGNHLAHKPQFVRTSNRFGTRFSIQRRLQIDGAVHELGY
jgi:hypothetical protein